jgi:hypothetical protein
LLYLAVILLFTISPSVLYRAGINYAASGGNPLGKFHPGTLVAIAAFALYLLRGGIDRSLGRLVSAYPGAALFGGLWAVAILYIATVLTVPVTPVLETFLLPLVLFGCIAVRGAPPAGLVRLIHLAFALNALLALGEFLTHRRLTPLMAGTIEITDDWRSSALFGHPLTNAMLTACYLAILLAGARGLPLRWRMPMIGLQTLGLAVFGGRTALVLSLAMLAAAAGFSLLRFFGGTRVRLKDLVLLALALPLLGAAAGLLIERGFFDLLLERFVSDNGSAQTRVVMFRLFEALSSQAVLFGPDPALIATLVQREGLEFGIESFPVAFVMFYGAIVTAMLFGGLFAFCVSLVRATRPASAFVLMLFFIIAATSLSLAGKSTIFGLLTVMLLTMMASTGPQPLREPAP